MKKDRKGFTLVELTLVTLLVGILAALAAVRFGAVSRRAERRAAEADLLALRDAFLGTSAAPGHRTDLGSIPGYSPALLRVGNLLVPTNLYGIGNVRLDAEGAPPEGNAPASAFTSWDAGAGRGWRGPYLSGGHGVADGEGGLSDVFPRRDQRRHEGDASFGDRGFYPSVRHLSLPDVFRNDTAGLCSVYGFAGEPAVGDPWGNPYVLQVPPPEAFGPGAVSPRLRFRYARLVSAGPDGLLSTPCFAPDGTAGWTPAARRHSRLAGRDADGVPARGDDLVLFLERADLYEEDEP